MKNRALIGIGLSCVALSAPLQAQVAPVPVAQSANEFSLRRASNEFEVQRDEYGVVMQALATIQQQFRDSTHRLDVSPEGLQKSAGRLDELLEGLELEKVAAAARQKAIEVAFEEESKRAQARMQSDPVAIQLMKVVEARTEQMKTLQSLVNLGTVPLSDVQNAQATVAEAQAKVAERQHAALASGDAETIASLRRDLLNLTIGEEERNAQIAYLNKRRQGLESALQDVPRLKRAQDELEFGRRKYERALERYDEQRQTYERNRAGESAPATNEAKGASTKP